jgi:iron complex outermembrane receptor protein
MTNRLNLTARGAFLSSAALFAFAAAAPASAQVQQQPAPQDDQSTTDVDQATIVITAQKREESILQIPQSVTVVSGDTIERQHASTFEQYLNQIPGLSITEASPGATRLTLRGVNTEGVSSTVAVYVDEMPFGSSTALVNGAVVTGDIDPFDMARIEVLRGPQGTLYGANSLGGIFKYVTNAPKFGQFSARGRAGVEFVDDGGTGYNANAVFNAPLGSTAAVRVSGFYRKRAGWVDNNPQDITFDGLFNGAIGPDFDRSVTATSLDREDINDNSSYGGRASVLVQPVEPLTIRLTAYAQNLNTHASNAVEVDPDNLEPINGKFGQTGFIPEFNHIKYRIYNATVDYDLGFANLTSATSYGKLHQSFRLDATTGFAAAFNSLFGPLNPFPNGFPAFGIPAPISPDFFGVLEDEVVGLKKFTQEIRLASPSNDKFEWMIGGYYTKEKGVIEQHINGQVLDDPNELKQELTDLLFLSLDSKYTEIAGFANVTWHVTDRFDLSGGARESHNKQHSNQVVGGPFTPFQFPGGIPIFEPGNSSESVFTYSLSPRFELSDETAVYARVAKGYRPGGPNAVPPLAGPDLAAFPVTFDADTLTSYEVGLKTDVGRHLSFDVAAYHLTWKDIQVLGSINNFNFNDNAGRARVNGLEGTLTARPTRGLDLSINGAWMDAELADDTPAIVGGQAGDSLPYSPKISFGANADYEWMVSPSITAFVGGSLRYVGKQRAGFRSEVIGVTPPPDPKPIFGPVPQRRIPDYATIDLRAGADFDRFTLEAYVRNLTNSRGITNLSEGLGVPNGGIVAAYIQPRTIGFSLGAKF